jgi:IS30 family transposase
MEIDHGSIRNLLAQRGGIVPSVRTRAILALTLVEREDISRGIACGESGRSIADRIGRAASTVSREIARHGGRSGYRANNANDGAWESGLRPKPCLLALNRKLRNMSDRDYV